MSAGFLPEDFLQEVDEFLLVDSDDDEEEGTLYSSSFAAEDDDDASLHEDENGNEDSERTTSEEESPTCVVQVVAALDPTKQLTEALPDVPLKPHSALEDDDAEPSSTSIVAKQAPEAAAPSPASSPAGTSSIHKSALKKSSSYGELEELGTDIPICSKKSSWKTLPPPPPIANNNHGGTMRRVGSSPALLEAASTTMKRNVSFSQIHIREHDVTVGDSPCLFGAPVGLDWHFEEKQPVGLDAFEANRPKRRSHRQMHLNSYQRRDLLKKANLSEKEIQQAQRKAAQTRRQRAATIHRLPLMKLEDLIESATRKMKKRLGGGGKNNKETTSTCGGMMKRSKSAGCLLEDDDDAATVESSEYFSQEYFA